MFKSNEVLVLSYNFFTFYRGGFWKKYFIKQYIKSNVTQVSALDICQDVSTFKGGLR